jgi:hypothetical protein
LIATASRPETHEWAAGLEADHVWRSYLTCGITVSNHPGVLRHPSLSKEGKFHNRYRSASIERCTDSQT